MGRTAYPGALLISPPTAVCGLGLERTNTHSGTIQARQLPKTANSTPTATNHWHASTVVHGPMSWLGLTTNREGGASPKNDISRLPSIPRKQERAYYLTFAGWPVVRGLNNSCNFQASASCRGGGLEGFMWGLPDAGRWPHQLSLSSPTNGPQLQLAPLPGWHPGFPHLIHDASSMIKSSRLRVLLSRASSSAYHRPILASAMVDKAKGKGKAPADDANDEPNSDPQQHTASTITAEEIRAMFRAAQERVRNEPGEVHCDSPPRFPN